MKHDPITSNKRKSVNVSLDTGVVAAARAMGLNLSRITEAAIREATKRHHERQWREDNSEWIEGLHRQYEAEGDPLAHLELP